MTPSFTLFSLPHFTALVIVIGITALAILILQKYAHRLDRARFDHYLALLVLFDAVAWKFFDIMQEDFSLAENLPFHVCGVTPYLIAAYLLQPRQQLFDVLFYWVLAGASLALILPDLEAGFPSWKFTGFFIGHGLPLFAMLYLILVRDIKPSPKSFLRAFIALNLYAFIIAAPVNLLVGGNYVYLRGAPEVDFGPIQLLPPWPWHLLPIELFALVLFRIMYQPFHLLAGKEEAAGLVPHNSASHR